MTRQEQVLWFINVAQILAIGAAAFAVAAVIYQGFRKWLPGKEGKLSRQQIRRQARKAAKGRSQFLSTAK